MNDEDLDEIARLEPILFGAGGWSRTMLIDELTGQGRFYIVAENADQIVGYAGLWFDGTDAQVMTIGTVPEHQGRGVGRALLRELIDRATRLGSAQIFLEVRVDNDPAVHLYHSEGFETMGRRPRYYQPEGADAWTMRKRIRP